MQRNSSVAIKTQTSMDIVGSYVFRAVGALGVDTRNPEQSEEQNGETPKSPHPFHPPRLP